MATMTVSEARAALPEVLDRVAEGEEVTITRHGRPVAVVVRPDILWTRRAGPALDDAERIHALLTEAGTAALPGGPRPCPPRRRVTYRPGQDRGRPPGVDAFDADALIYAAVPGHPLGERVAALFQSPGVGAVAGAGLGVLLPAVGRY